MTLLCFSIISLLDYNASRCLNFDVRRGFFDVKFLRYIFPFKDKAFSSRITPWLRLDVSRFHLLKAEIRLQEMQLQMPPPPLPPPPVFMEGRAKEGAAASPSSALCTLFLWKQVFKRSMHSLLLSHYVKRLLCFFSDWTKLQSSQATGRLTLIYSWWCVEFTSCYVINSYQKNMPDLKRNLWISWRTVLSIVIIPWTVTRGHDRLLFL